MYGTKDETVWFVATVRNRVSPPSTARLLGLPLRSAKSSSALFPPAAGASVTGFAAMALERLRMEIVELSMLESATLISRVTVIVFTVEPSNVLCAAFATSHRGITTVPKSVPFATPFRTAFDSCMRLESN
jgi:hypothetical protein